MANFSKELVLKLREMFGTKYGIELSEDTAQEYLKSYADLYLIFAKSEK